MWKSRYWRSSFCSNIVHSCRLSMFCYLQFDEKKTVSWFWMSVLASKDVNPVTNLWTEWITGCECQICTSMVHILEIGKTECVPETSVHVISLKIGKNGRLVVVAAVDKKYVIHDFTGMIRPTLDNIFGLIEHDFPALGFKMIEGDLVWENFYLIFALSNFSLASKYHKYVFPNVNGWTWKRIWHLIMLNWYFSPLKRIMSKVYLKTIKVNSASVSSKNKNFVVLNKKKCIFSWNRRFTQYSFSRPITHFWKNMFKNLVLFLWIC